MKRLSRMRETQPMNSSKVRPSWSLLVAVAIAAIGVLRLSSDFLTDIDPTWATVLGDSPQRFLARTTDGSLVGDLNVQYLKITAIPSYPLSSLLQYRVAVVLVP